MWRVENLIISKRKLEIRKPYELFLSQQVSILLCQQDYWFENGVRNTLVFLQDTQQAVSKVPQ